MEAQRTTDVIERIVEKNEKFFRLISDSTLTQEQQLALHDEIFPPKQVAA